MPIDNLYISGLAHELNEELSGARIDKKISTDQKRKS